MAIRLSNLDLISKQLTNKDFIYKDLSLDIEDDSRYDSTSNTQIPANDINASYDEAAIRNSLKNLFNTRPGQRFLFPEYGLDLYQFLFEPVTFMNAQMIGERIVSVITTYEPRVEVLNVDVKTLEEENAYQIQIVVFIPILNTSTSINTNLDVKNQSFTFLGAAGRRT